MTVRRLVGVCALAALCAATSAGPAHARASAGAKPAPAFSLPARSGSVSLDSLRGHVVYVDFWASWCGPCRSSFPWMSKLAERYGPQGLSVVAVNLDKDRALADAFLAEHPASFSVAFDPSGRTAASYGVSAMPTSFLIGRDGRLLWTHRGFDERQADQVEARVQAALAP